ncbi:MAG: hypothetical protein AB7S69_03375 [Salinivirgaceae bacterium]
MTKNRSYSYKDIDMLMVSKTIAESFKANIAELSVTRTDWTETYATGLISRIDNAIESHLGIDAFKDLRSATTNLKAVQISAQNDLSYFKTQIDDDFKKDPAKRDEILNTLGLTKHLKAVQKDNQESLIQLLYQFKANMTEDLRLQITEKGMNQALIDRIIGYTNTFIQANVTQEALKGSTREISKEVADLFSSIYDEMIGICKKASNYYKHDPVKKAQFTFSKVLANMGLSSKTKETEPPVEETPIG